MTPRKATALVAILALVLLAPPPAHAVTVEKLDLGQMVERAGSVTTVTVLAARPSTVRLRGGELPVTVYSVRVDEALVGALPRHDNGRHDDGRTAELTFLRNPGPTETRGGLIHRSNLPELPSLRVGGRYLLLSTTPSLVGLSAPVGLEQGVFRVVGKPGAETAENGLGNAGLFAGVESFAPAGWTSGPIPYDQLTAAIRGLATR